MTSTPQNRPHIPQLHINIDTLLDRIAHARARTCEQCQDPVTSLIADIARLAGEITRLNSELIHERLISANLRAAIRAALGAQADGEPDPLAYLTDELPEIPGSEPIGEWGRF
jgi:hypothetical protein